MGTQENIIDGNDIQTLKNKYGVLDNDFVVGIVGRIEDAKGQFLVIEAIELLKDLNIKAMIVGHTMDEEYLDNLKQKIKDLDIEEKVIFTGFTKEVDAHMQLFDVNILATPKETFGLVVIEAMMNKVCMIATNNGGPLEIIDDEQTGLLFDRTSKDLALKIKKLYDNPTLKHELSQKGYEKAQKEFNSDIQFNKLYGVVNES
jgi:glycosyltransferase involved in cell wall biosynthesis